MAATDPRLEQAKNLIQANKRTEARELLVGLLKEDSTSTKALYLYAHVARNEGEARKVLQRLLEIDPLHYQARAALNKLENRSVEQISPSKAAPPVATSPRQPAPVARPRSGANRALMVLLSLGLVAVVVAIVWLLLFAESTDEPILIAIPDTQEPTRLVSVTPVNSPLPSFSPTATVNITAAPLQESWTPLPTLTPPPTRTQGPPLVLPPTNTLVPTHTPTLSTVTMLDINLVTAARLYTDYNILAAQSSWIQDPAALAQIGEAFDKIIASLELSNYASTQGAEPGLIDYLGDFVTLLRYESQLADTRQEVLLLLQSEDAQGEMVSLEQQLNRLVQRRLAQYEQVDAAYWRVVNNATATVVWQQRFDNLKTPSATFIVIPTVTLSTEVE